jgi:hypothetical protein
MRSIYRRAFVLSVVLLTLALHAQWQPPPLQPLSVQVSGRVVRADNGAPLEGATVSLRPARRYQGNLHLKTTKTDSNGEYQFHGAVDDAYEIIASAEGFVTANSTVQRMTASTVFHGIDLQLVPETARP